MKKEAVYTILEELRRQTNLVNVIYLIDNATADVILNFLKENFNISEHSLRYSTDTRERKFGINNFTNE